MATVHVETTDHVEDHVEEWGPDQQLGGSATSERGAAERREELPLGESTVVMSLCAGGLPRVRLFSH